MKILHTSDWHLGAKLYERSRESEHAAFLDWLLDTIIAKKVDVLLVAGDVFDTAVPAAQTETLYYQFLLRLYQETDIIAVIAAGNHDSAKRLAAPREFLKMARIHIIGLMPENPADVLIPIEKNGKKVWIGAVPYLSEGELLSHVSFEKKVESARRYREAIKQLNHEVAAAVPDDAPLILSGHYFMNGGSKSGSERLVEIGGASPVSAEDIPKRACYMALGHLHRHQKLNGHCPVYYSGSPLPMTFKEAEYEQQVLLLDVSPAAEVMVSPLPIPRFRLLKRIQGDFDEIMAVAEGGDWTGTLIEVTLDLKEPQVGLSDRIRQAFAERGGEVALVQARFVNEINGEQLPPEELMTQSPETVFRQFYEQKLGEIASPDEENRFGKLEMTFAELIKLWQIDQDNSDDERGEK